MATRMHSNGLILPVVSLSFVWILLSSQINVRNTRTVSAFAPLLSSLRSSSNLNKYDENFLSALPKAQPTWMIGNHFDDTTDVHDDWTTNAISTPTRASSTTQPTPILAKAFANVVSPSRSATAATSAIATAALILSMSLLPADAAMSGGRMGGSFSSSPRSMPSRSSYSGGGGGGGGGSSRGYYGGSSYYSRPRTTIVAPIISPFYNPIMPYSPIVPFYGGGVGAISYNRGPGLFDLLFLGGLGWFAVSAVSGLLNGRGSGINQQWSDETWGRSSSSDAASVLGPGTSVVRLSVALDVPNRDDPNSLLSVLDRLSSTAQTGTRKNVQDLTSQVALELLRRKSSIQSAATAYKHSKDDRAAQRWFNEWSVSERSKFERENISKFTGVDYSNNKQRLSGGNADASGKATMAVVTLVLSIQGDSTVVPMISTLADVENALRKIAADVKVNDCLTGAEILWTPEDRSEVLSRQNIVADYPELISL